MKPTANRISTWRTVSLTAALYAAAILILTLFTKTDEFWAELCKTPGANTGFILHSFPFVAVWVVFAAIGGWVPNRAGLVVFRRSIVAACVLALIVACLLMIAFGFGFDWKLST